MYSIFGPFHKISFPLNLKFKDTTKGTKPSELMLSLSMQKLLTKKKMFAEFPLNYIVVNFFLLKIKYNRANYLYDNDDDQILFNWILNWWEGIQWEIAQYQ